jgi:hypothetical protein
MSQTADMRKLLDLLDLTSSKKNLNEDVSSDMNQNNEPVENPKDKVTVEIPLLIRLLEYAREDAKTDMDLHNLTEKLIALSSEQGKTLSMQDYDQLVSNQDVTPS